MGIGDNCAAVGFDLRHGQVADIIITVGGVSAAVSKTAAAPIERIKLLVQNQVCTTIASQAQSALHMQSVQGRSGYPGAANSYVCSHVRYLSGLY